MDRVNLWELLRRVRIKKQVRLQTSNHKAPGVASLTAPLLSGSGWYQSSAFHLSFGMMDRPVLAFWSISQSPSGDDASPAKQHAAPVMAMGSWHW